MGEDAARTVFGSYFEGKDDSCSLFTLSITGTDPFQSASPLGGPLHLIFPRGIMKGKKRHAKLVATSMSCGPLQVPLTKARKTEVGHYPFNLPTTSLTNLSKARFRRSST